jgi:tetratricopeptide (TPR) repeat protein
MKKQAPLDEPTSWLEQAYPQMHYLVLALDGDAQAPDWLEQNSRGTTLFRRALAGEKLALTSLQNGAAEELDDLFEVIDNEDLSAWLAERRPELHLLFEAIKGNEEAAVQLRRRKPAYARLVPTFREVHERFLKKANGNTIEDGAAADMGCLLGEMHLREGEFEKAIDAFTRAIDTRPAADLYEGRARAYRALAERDMAAAALLRQRHP